MPLPPEDTGSLEDSLYAELYRRHAPALFAYVYRRVASREDAEDLVLDVFLSVLRNRRFPTFDESKREAWLWTITRNKLVDYLRRGMHRQQVSIELLAELLAEDERRSPERLSLRREALVRLSEAIRTLPALQQEILRLRFGHGLKTKDIAAILEKSEGSIRTTLLRALQRLRARYDEYETEANDGRTAEPLHARGDR
jgi:RNA polymerase sigma-70 factor (ECF subfamily)